MKMKPMWALIGGLAILGAVAAAGLLAGLPDGAWGSVLWKVRLFRILAGAVVGGSLGLAGLSVQGFLRNPLAEPYVLGVSSGAGVGVLLGGLLAAKDIMPETISTPLLAIAGGAATSMVVWFIAQRQGTVNSLVLLLSGVIVNVLNGAIIVGILQLVRSQDLVYFVSWGIGELPESLWYRPGLLIAAAAVLAAGAGHIAIRAASLNAMDLGDDVAVSIGVNANRLRIELFITACLLTSMAVALAGPLGFVGLVVPHIARLAMGPDHRALVPACALGGASFVIACDWISRSAGRALGGTELPVGLMTSLIGAPVFLWLLKRQVRQET